MCLHQRHIYLSVFCRNLVVILFICTVYYLDVQQHVKLLFHAISLPSNNKHS